VVAGVGVGVGVGVAKVEHDAATSVIRSAGAWGVAGI
jgi:hypothetical protein